MSTNERRPIYWTGIPPVYDAWGIPIYDVFYDVETPLGWGYASPKSFFDRKLKTGIGLGQKYERQPDGRWLQTEGGSGGKPDANV